jgi:uncharacterized protein YndB with AHSA1/START domain
MATHIDVSPADERELVLARILDAPCEAVFRCWIEPKLMVQWFTPPPWKTIHAETDPRAGGSSLVVMQGPDGEKVPNRGVYLDLVPNARIVFTDAFTSAWEPSDKPFFCCTLTFEDLGNGKTRYIARARHWLPEDKKAHEEMGFHDGWGVATEQLEALAKSL